MYVTYLLAYFDGATIVISAPPSTHTEHMSINARSNIKTTRRSSFYCVLYLLF